MSSPQAHAQPTSTWTEPPWCGWIETTGDALLILEAARRGLIPRVTRRLVDSERKMITSGSVFVFDEDESGIKRWTDGFFWSPSRILGNFLLYRETDKRGSGHRGSRSDGSTSDSNNADGKDRTLSRPKSDMSTSPIDKHRVKTLMGSLTNSYKFKPDGLMKKTFSLTIGGVSQHLISYYKIEDVENGRLRSPSSLPELASLDISPEYLDKTHFRNPPKVEIGADGLPRYRGEADDIDIPDPLSAGLPLLTGGHIAESSSAANSRRGKPRFEPYLPPPATKRPRRQQKSSQADPSSPLNDQQAVVIAQPHISPTPSLDPNAALAQPVPYPPPYGVPGYYQFPSYPAPPHMYPPPIYPPPPGVPVPHAPTPVAPYPPYPAYPALPAPESASQPMPPSQAPTFYSYPPPPPGVFPQGYAGAPWPQYHPHAPHPMPTQGIATFSNVEGSKEDAISVDGRSSST